MLDCQLLVRLKPGQLHRSGLSRHIDCTSFAALLSRLVGHSLFVDDPLIITR